jgi:exodeoxyribonuclease VII small subunit
MSPKAKSKTKAVEAVTELTFEQAFQELEEIIRQLEAGQLALDGALLLFERAQALAARCGALLDSAELKVRQLVPKEGGYELEDFEEAGE